MMDIDTPMLELEDEHENPIKKMRMEPDFYRPPSAEELYNLKNSENLYQSNLFRLQLEELTAEITISPAEIKAAEIAVNELTRVLNKLKPVADLKFTDLKMFEDAGINVPLGGLGKKIMKEGTYSFQPPVDVFCIGSHALNTNIKTNQATSIDLAIEIDPSYFSERDYLNYRYFLKRNLYVSHVYMQLMATKKYSKAKYEFVADQSSVHTPVLCVALKDEPFEINLHIVPGIGTFKPNRFNPSQSNVRRDFFTKYLNSYVNFEQNGKSSQNGHSNGDVDNEDSHDPTPSYNFDILSDLTTKANTEYLKEKLGNSKGVVEAIKLLKLWFMKRELNTGSGSFDNFTLSMFMAYLIANRHVNPHMSSYQIFRIALLNLSEANWHTSGISVKDSLKVETIDAKQLPIREFHKFYQVVFVDSTGFLNVTSKMSTHTFLRIKHEAQLGMSLLNNELSADNFNQLFIKNHTSQLVFDALFSINPFSNSLFYFDVLKKVPSEQARLMDNYNNSYNTSLNVIVNLINNAIKERVELVYAHFAPKQRWSINARPSDDLPPIIIGILFNDKNESTLIKGPSSTSSEAAEFRKFWGKKSELRRFQDTSICEAVYFEAANIAAKRLVYTEIIKYILNFDENLQFCDRQMNNLLSLPTGTINNYGTGEERLANVVTTFDEFIRLLKNLKDLPLAINNIHGVSSAFRLTDVFAPLPCCFKYDVQGEKNMRVKLENKYVPKYPLGPVMVPYIKPIEAFIQLESSGKWPDDLECIRRLKTAFYMKIVQMLRESCGLTAFTNIDHFDVVFKGLVFRLHVKTMNELLCIKNEINELGIITTNDTKESIEYERIFFALPKITNVLHGIQQKHTCYSGVCRLAKRWLSSQFLLEYFEEEAIDLICAYLFEHSSAYNTPKSIITGFIRFVDLMANFDWKNQLLSINFNNEFKKDELLSIQLQFQENRSSVPPVFISTPYDGAHKNSIWTMEKPNMQQLCRTVMIAKQTLVKIKQSVVKFESTESFKNLFRPNLVMFDVVIHLKPSYCVKAHQQVDICEGTFLPHYRDFDAADNKDRTFPVVDFDPVRHYVRELREAYDDIALFFYDVYGCTKVYALWKPEALKPREAKIGNVKYRLIDAATNTLELNLEAILDDFKLIGNELVERVAIKTESNIFK